MACFGVSLLAIAGVVAAIVIACMMDEDAKKAAAQDEELLRTNPEAWKAKKMAAAYVEEKRAERRREREQTALQLRAMDLERQRIEQMEKETSQRKFHDAANVGMNLARMWFGS